MRYLPLFLFALLVNNLNGCTYLRIYNEQLDLAEKQASTPSQRNLKHLLNTENILLYGALVDLRSAGHNKPLCVLALSNRYSKHEIVDSSCDNSPNHYYKLNLPLGTYLLVVIEDTNENMQYQGTEMIASRKLSLTSGNTINQVRSDTDIVITNNKPELLADINLTYKGDGRYIKSLFYPDGFIRTLENPVFSRKYAVEGLYDISDFIEDVPKMFYALDEFNEFRIPVIFVHGINGTPRDFIPVLNTLDRSRFSPYFFYYPSGSHLNQLATYFYNMALSGHEYRSRPHMPIIIIAHSMGGVIVREALNLYQENKHENKVAMFISIASPFGGHPGAQLAVDTAPLLIPSWLELSSESRFIQNLQRESFPESMQHYLFFAYANNKKFKFGENSDGAVPLSSQLDPDALKNATKIYAYNKTHTSILRDNDAIEQIQSLLASVKFPYPPRHQAYLDRGGFHLELDKSFTAKEQYAIETYGYYLQALAQGNIKPVYKEQREFVQIVKGRKNKMNLGYFESAWLKFRKRYPDLASRITQSGSNH